MGIKRHYLRCQTNSRASFFEIVFRGEIKGLKDLITFEYILTGKNNLIFYFEYTPLQTTWPLRVDVRT